MKPHEQIKARYPRLIRAMRWIACLTIGEAVAAIQCHQNGDNWSGEAVNHFGGNRALFLAAWDCRVITALPLTGRSKAHKAKVRAALIASA